MKWFRLLFIFLVVVACKSKSPTVDKSVSNIKKLSAKKIIKNHQDNSFKARTLDARLRVLYSDNKGDVKNRESLTVRLRIYKDSVIWIKGSKVVSAFKAMITPNSFSYYSPISKEYIEGDFTYLKDLIGVDINFNQLQNLFFGQSIWDLKEQKFDASIEKKTHKLTPKKQEEFYSIFFYFYPTNFRLQKQSILSKEEKMLNVVYPGYLSKESEFFPRKIEINITDKDHFTMISMEVRSLDMNKPISTVYQIPEGYKKIELKK